MRPTQRAPARLRSYNCIRSRQSTEVEFPMRGAVLTIQPVGPRNILRPHPRGSTRWSRLL